MPDSVEPLTLTSILGRVTKPFYNKEKGGIQFGGIIGALLGLTGGYFLTDGLSGGMMSFAGVALLTGLGAWAGNQAVDIIHAKNPSLFSQNTGESPNISKAKNTEIGLCSADPQLGRLPSPATPTDRSKEATSSRSIT